MVTYLYHAISVVMVTYLYHAISVVMVTEMIKVLSLSSSVSLLSDNQTDYNNPSSVQKYRSHFCFTTRLYSGKLKFDNQIFWRTKRYLVPNCVANFFYSFLCYSFSYTNGWQSSWLRTNYLHMPPVSWIPICKPAIKQELRNLEISIKLHLPLTFFYHPWKYVYGHWISQPLH